MFIFSDFLSHVFIILVLAGAVTFFLFSLKKDIELTIGKNTIQKLGWGWAVLVWLAIGIGMEALWHLIKTIW